MNAVSVSAKMDTSGLEAVIPELLAYGRRTMREQCVTSMGMILQDAQTWTPFVDIGRMDSELDEVYTGKNGKGTLTRGEMIVLSRAHPDSKFNTLTGSRWALTIPSFKSADFHRAYGDAGMAKLAFMAWLQSVEERQKAARHSSGHFLQSGYKAARDECVTSEFFRNRYRKRDGGANDNALNRLDKSNLGGTVIELTGDDCVVTAMNNVGEGGNAVLDKKHRDALIEHSAGPLQDSVNKETAACQVELERRVAEKWPVFNKMLS